MPLLEVDNLSVSFAGRDGETTDAVSQLSYSVDPGSCVGLVGESGCGKSVSSLAIMGLLPDRGCKVAGRIAFEGQTIVDGDRRKSGRIAGSKVAMIFQDPLSALNPVLKIGIQIYEVLVRHRRCARSQVHDRACELLSQVGLPDPGRCLKSYPHQLSGGMRQRVLIAMALAGEPRLLIADEPTTALDVTVQAQILDLLRNLIEERNIAMIMISHDLGVVARICDHVNVMYAGRIVERAPCATLLKHPRHRYTEGLLGSMPKIDSRRDERLVPIPGSVANRIQWAEGCAFAPRCRFRSDACLRADLPLVADGATDHRCVHPADLAADAKPAGATR